MKMVLKEQIPRKIPLLVKKRITARLALLGPIWISPSSFSLKFCVQMK